MEPGGKKVRGLSRIRMLACMVAGWAGVAAAAVPPDLPKSTEYYYVIASEGLGLGLENHLQRTGAPECTELRAGIAGLGGISAGNLKVTMAHRRQGVDAARRRLAAGRIAALSARVIR